MKSLITVLASTNMVPFIIIMSVVAENLGNQECRILKDYIGNIGKKPLNC